MYIRITKSTGNDTPKKAHTQDNNNNPTLVDYPMRLDYVKTYIYKYYIHNEYADICMYICVPRSRRQPRAEPPAGRQQAANKPQAAASQRQQAANRPTAAASQTILLQV